MPLAGQASLVRFVNNGGGLVTSEWCLWDAAALGTFTTLAPLFPVVPTSEFDSEPTGNFSMAVPDSVLDAGLPAAFSTPLTSISGTETHFTTLRPGAVSYFSNNGFIGVAGVSSGAGRVLSFNTVNGQDQVADPNFGRLLSNSMNWAAGGINTATPEPDTLVLVAPGALFLAGAVRRRRKRA